MSIAWLKIPGIPGTGSETSREDWIVLSGFKTGRSKGYGWEGDVHAFELEAMRPIDAASPALAEAAHHGKSYPEIVLDFLPDGDRGNRMELRLKHATIVRHSIEMGIEGHAGRDLLTVRYLAVTWIHHPADAAPVRREWPEGVSP